MFLVALLVRCVCVVRVCVWGGVCVWPSRRVMFPFLDLNSLPDTGPKGHSGSASSTARTDNTSAHGRDGRPGMGVWGVGVR